MTVAPTEASVEAPCRDFLENLALLHQAAEADPVQVRVWLQRHPRNLMIYCGWDPKWFHDEGFEHFLGNRSSLWLAPRGSGKSTVAVFYAAWLGLADPKHWDPSIGELFPDAPRKIGPWNIRIAITSNSHPKACALLWQIKAILTSREIQRLFGPLAGKRWKDELADTRKRNVNLREATYTALGLGSKVTGGHYDAEIHDDWVTEDNARTALQRGRLADFWSFTVRPTCEPWGRALVCGTRYHPKDWYGTLVEGSRKNPERWAVLRHPAVTYDSEGEARSYWREVYPLAVLDELRDEIGSIAFASQYQNEVDLMLGDFFEASYLEQFQSWSEVPKVQREFAVTSIALDAAFKGGPKHDWSVFSVCHMVRRPMRFHFERIVRGKWTKDELVRRAEYLVKAYDPALLTVEAAPGVEFLIQDLRNSKAIPRRIVKAMPPRIGKIPRADKGRTLFERGWVWWDPPTRENQLQIALDELLAFTGEPGNEDDCVDSCMWNLIGLTRGRGRLRRASGVHNVR